MSNYYHNLRSIATDFRDMPSRDKLLIWREKKEFFYAIDQENNLCIWSMFTGEKLYCKQLS